MSAPPRRSTHQRRGAGVSYEGGAAARQAFAAAPAALQSSVYSPCNNNVPTSPQWLVLPILIRAESGSIWVPKMQERTVPGLFGQPLKNRLRKEIHQLRTDLWNLRKEHGNALHSLKYTQSKVEELEAKLKRIKNAAGGIIAEIDQDVRPAVFERYKKRIFGR